MMCHRYLSTACLHAVEPGRADTASDWAELRAANKAAGDHIASLQHDLAEAHRATLETQEERDAARREAEDLRALLAAERELGDRQLRIYPPGTWFKAVQEDDAEVRAELEAARTEVANLRSGQRLIESMRQVVDEAVALVNDWQADAQTTSGYRIVGAAANNSRHALLIAAVQQWLAMQPTEPLRFDPSIVVDDAALEALARTLAGDSMTDGG